jgi:hypothetical protein
MTNTEVTITVAELIQFSRIFATWKNIIENDYYDSDDATKSVRQMSEFLSAKIGRGVYFGNAIIEMVESKTSYYLPN